MAFTRSDGWNPELALKRGRSLLAEYAAIVAAAEAELAQPEALRPIGGPVVEAHARRMGLPVARALFDRPAALHAREQLHQMLVGTRRPRRRWRVGAEGHESLRPAELGGRGDGLDQTCRGGRRGAHWARRG